MDAYIQVLRQREQFGKAFLKTILHDLSPHKKLYEIVEEQLALLSDIRNSIRDRYQELRVRKARLSKQYNPVGT